MIIPIKQRTNPFKSFDNEADALDWTMNFLVSHGFDVEPEKWLSPRLRCDLYVTMKHGINFPLEIKPDLTCAANIARAVSQAADYAQAIRKPAFIGPIVHNVDHKQFNTSDSPFIDVEMRRELNHLNGLEKRLIDDYLLFAMRQNVGFLEIASDQSWMLLRQEPGRRFILHKNDQETDYRLEFWGWRSSYGSNFKFHTLAGAKSK